MIPKCEVLAFAHGVNGIEESQNLGVGFAGIFGIEWNEGLADLSSVQIFPTDYYCYNP
jgi:hypothetical protein